MLKKSHMWFTISTTPYIWLFDNNYFSLLQEHIPATSYIVGSGLLIYGSRFPDIDLKLKKILPESIKEKRYYYHRQLTHSLLLWIIISFLVYSAHIAMQFKVIIYMFVFGVFTHLIADMLTGTIPVFLYGTYRKGAKNRIGISSFFPWKYREMFTKSFPKWLDKNLWIFILFFLINLLIVYIYTK